MAEAVRIAPLAAGPPGQAQLLLRGFALSPADGYPAAGLPETAWNDLSDALDRFPPFRLELTSIEVFEGSNVIYLSVGAGYRELETMHAELNRGPLAFAEPFEYHPHVTLAQELLPQDVDAALARARGRWREFPSSHSFIVDRLTFVQNTQENRWADLAGRMLSIRMAS